jgi:peptidoglycan/xylan/chitin deacetylase (PgdA/CDA1 family)
MTGRFRAGGLALQVLAVGALHALPALTAPGLTDRGPLRAVRPRLAGQGRPGGVALTFDDGPDPLGTPAILATLHELGWTATFFLLGSQVRRHPGTARSIAAAGHEIAVHGHEHRPHLARPARWVRRDLAVACDEIASATGVRPRWFRPPYGVLSAGSLRAAGELGLTPVLWTTWGRDWEAGPAETVMTHLSRNLRDGGTILLHDSDCTSRPGSWRSTLAALPLLADDLGRRGLAVRPLRDHLGDPA